MVISCVKTFFRSGLHLSLHLHAKPGDAIADRCLYKCTAKLVADEVFRNTLFLVKFTYINMPFTRFIT